MIAMAKIPPPPEQRSTASLFLRTRRHLIKDAVGLILAPLFGSSFASGQEKAPDANPPKPNRSITYKKTGDRGQFRQALYVFDPPGWKPSDRRPCFLAVHGGGWTGGKPDRTHEIASHFAGLGIVGISLKYRLLNPKLGQTVADCVRDGRSAVRYLRSHAAELGIDPDKIIVCGFSAGGHIAAGTALFEGVDEAGEDLSVSSRPEALVLFCPVLDTSPEGYGSGKVGEQWRELSAIERMRPGIPPAIIFHVKGDPVVPYKGSARFAEAMVAAGNACELVGYEGEKHCGITQDPAQFKEAMDRTTAFLRTWKIISEEMK